MRESPEKSGTSSNNRGRKCRRYEDQPVATLAGFRRPAAFGRPRCVGICGSHAQQSVRLQENGVQQLLEWGLSDAGIEMDNHSLQTALTNIRNESNEFTFHQISTGCDCNYLSLSIFWKLCDTAASATRSMCNGSWNLVSNEVMVCLKLSICWRSASFHCTYVSRSHFGLAGSDSTMGLGSGEVVADYLLCLRRICAASELGCM